MKKRLMSIVMMLVLAMSLVACGSNAGTDSAAATRTYDPNDTTIYIPDPMVPLAGTANSGALGTMAKQALDQVNVVRAASGLPALKWNAGLETAAKVRASELPQSFSHTRPNGSDWWTVDGNLCYGENLAMDYYSAGEAVSAWQASPTHNANLLDGGFRSCAIAIYENNGTYYWAQEFGY